MGGAVRDVVLLVLACLVLYGTGLDVHGVTNWQEAQRVVVARDMQRRAAAGEDGAWIVPRHNGQAYVAKPPMIYWATVGLAELRAGEVELFDLRLAVALAGTLGVVGTYIVARGVLRPVGESGGTSHVAGARWAAVFLATGVLYFRSARIGELDILLVPGVVGAVGCIWAAWRAHLEREAREGGWGAPDWFGVRPKWGWVVLGAAFASVAVLTKGPPALMVIALAGYGAVVWRAASRRDAGRLATLGAVMGALACAGATAVGVSGPGDIVGVAMMGVIGGLLGAGVARLADARALREAWLGLAATHPAVVLGAPVLAFWWWANGVSSRIGPELAMELAQEQADNDLNLFMAASPMKNFEALAYGCGVGSVVMLVAAAWWVRYRPRADRLAGILVPVAWVVLSFCALSMFGKGVARYLTPVWPGVAMVAGAWVVRRREGMEGVVPDHRRLALLGATCAVLGVTQAWWYGHGREVFEHERSPRAMMRELEASIGPQRYASFEFYTPALDYYAGAYVQPVITAQMGRAVAGGPAWTMEQLVADVRERGPVVVLCREWSLDRSLPTPVERLRAAGLDVEPVELGGAGVFRIDNKRAVVRAVRVR